jgi:hypothetical protein
MKHNLVEEVGKAISKIVNQDGEKKTDGQCLDEVIEYLRNNNLYTKKSQQPAVEKQWEIESYMYASKEFCKIGNGYYWEKSDSWMEELYESSKMNATIHSVRIGTEVFSVGNKVVWNWNKGREYETIKKFEIWKGNLGIWMEVQGDMTCPYEKLYEPRWNLRHYQEPVQEKVDMQIDGTNYIVPKSMADEINKILQEAGEKKEPLLVTEDGVECKDGEEIVLGINTSSWGTVTKKVREIQHHYCEERWKWFIYEEARTDYIEYNKPCLSQKEVNELINKIQKIAAGDYKERLNCDLDTYVMNKLSNNQ